jgi:predicted metal-dependent HD superfamily phosphohydrolase
VAVTRFVCHRCALCARAALFFRDDLTQERSPHIEGSTVYVSGDKGFLNTAKMSSIISASESVLDRARFEALWRRCSTLDITADTTQVWDNLVKRYNESHRRYHSIKHLVFCLQQLDLAASFVEDIDAIEMAIWFHDVVFEPIGKDNEERSASLFKLVTKDYFAPDFVDTVSKIIVATKHHDTHAENNTAYMLDIDLASIGLPWAHFVQDCVDLRAEMRGISDIRFYSGKLVFLNALIERPRIYFTDYFFTRYEDKARKNIRRYISWLEAQGHLNQQRRM